MTIELRYNDDKTITGWQTLEELWISEPLRFDIADALYHFFPKAKSVHIEHVGTVGDPAHQARDSRHNDKPPAAIDIRWLDVVTGDGFKVRVDFTESLDNRWVAAKFWETQDGAKAYHVDEADKGHIHLQAVEA